MGGLYNINGGGAYEWGTHLGGELISGIKNKFRTELIRNESRRKCKIRLPFTVYNGLTGFILLLKSSQFISFEFELQSGDRESQSGSEGRKRAVCFESLRRFLTPDERTKKTSVTRVSIGHIMINQ